MSRINLYYNEKNHLTLEMVDSSEPKKLTIGIRSGDISRIISELGKVLREFLPGKTVAGVEAQLKLLSGIRSYKWKDILLQIVDL